MIALGYELSLVQNPALGATMIWRFATSFSQNNTNHEDPLLPICALILPMVWHHDTYTRITSTQQAKGIRSFVDKFTDGQEKRSDILLTIGDRTLKFRKTTMDSIRMGISCGLFQLTELGSVRSIKPFTGKEKLPDPALPYIKAADKLGFWLSNMSMREISTILHLKF